MPRGVPKNGFRVTKNVVARMNKGEIPMTHITSKIDLSKINPDYFPMGPVEPVKHETDTEIAERLKARFRILAQLTDAAINGKARSLIVSGPAGLGKSFTVEEKLNLFDPYGDAFTIVKGFVKTTGLYKKLYENRHKNSVIVFDDADSVFWDDTNLNMLKAVCDTTEKRVVSYLAETNMVSEDGDRLPTSFTFEGTIIFITNLDFDAMIEKGHRLAPHLSALVSRSHYIDLAMKTKRDYMVRIRQVVADGMLRANGLSIEEESDTLTFIEENMDRMRELSLRMALKVGALRHMNEGDWRETAMVTCCKNS